MAFWTDVLILCSWLEQFLWIFTKKYWTQPCHQLRKCQPASFGAQMTRHLTIKVKYSRSKQIISLNASAEIRFVLGIEGSIGSARVKITCELAVLYWAWARGLEMMLMHYSTWMKKDNDKAFGLWYGQLEQFVWMVGGLRDPRLLRVCFGEYTVYKNDVPGINLLYYVYTSMCLWVVLGRES